MNDFFALKLALDRSKSKKIVFKPNGTIFGSYSFSKSFAKR